MPGTVRYDAETNTIYAVAEGQQSGPDWMPYCQDYIKIVEDNDLKDYNTILDLSKLDPMQFNPRQQVPQDDPSQEWIGPEGWCTRKRGNGKVVLVISRSKGGTPAFYGTYGPDAIVHSIEDAEEYIATGMLYDRT